MKLSIENLATGSVQIEQPSTDITCIESLWVESEKELASAQEDTVPENLHSSFLKWVSRIRTKGYGLFLAKAEDTIIGYCVASTDEGEDGAIEQIYVIPKYRAQSVGTQLLTVALSWLKENAYACSSIKVSTPSCGNDLLQFYVHNGFELVSYTLHKTQ